MKGINGTLKESNMKIQVIIFSIILVLVLVGTVGIMVYHNSNRELLMGYYYNYDDNESVLVINEDGTFYFDLRVYVSWALEGTYKVQDNCLILYTTDDEEIKFEIFNKSIKVREGGNYSEKFLKEGMEYRWSAERK